MHTIVYLDSFGLFCYHTKWIYQLFKYIVHGLSVHLYFVGLIAVLNRLLNVTYVQMDNCSQFGALVAMDPFNFVSFHGNIIIWIIFYPGNKRISLVWVSLATRGFIHSNKGFP